MYISPELCVFLGFLVGNRQATSTSTYLTNWTYLLTLPNEKWAAAFQDLIINEAQHIKGYYSVAMIGHFHCSKRNSVLASKNAVTSVIKYTLLNNKSAPYAHNSTPCISQVYFLVLPNGYSLSLKLTIIYMKIYSWTVLKDDVGWKES